MAIDPNIFFQGAALRQANDARLQNTFETLAKTFMDRRAQQLKMEQDPDYIGQKIAAGQEITPQQQAIMRYRDTEQRVKNAQIDPNTGTMVLGPSLFDSLAPKSTDMPYQVQSPLFKSPSASLASPAAPMNGMINGAGSPMPPPPKTAGGFVNDLGGDLMVPPVGDNYTEIAQMSPDQRLAARTNPSGAALPVPQNPLQEKMNYQTQLDIGKDAAKAETDRVNDLKKTQPKAKASAIAQFDKMSEMEKTIDNAIYQTNKYTAGMGSLLNPVPGTPAADLKATLSTISADAAFGALQNMRDNSPTGGALGSTSEVELELLQNSLAALSQSQSPQQLKENLQNYKRIRQRALQRVAQAYEDTYGEKLNWSNPAFGKTGTTPTQNRLKYNQATGEFE